MLRFRTVMRAAALCAASMTLVVAMGCSGNKGYKKTTSATTSLESLASTLEDGGRQVETTMASLSTLMASTGDLRRPYDQFVNEIGKLERAADRAGNARKDFEKRRQAFLDEWEIRLDTVSSDEIRDLGRDRRNNAIQQFEKLDSTFNSVRESYDPLIAKLHDISAFLNVDLNRGSIDAARPSVNTANEESRILLDRIGIALREIRALADRVSPVTPEED